MVILDNSNEQMEEVDATVSIGEISENRIIDTYLPERCNDKTSTVLNVKDNVRHPKQIQTNNSVDTDGLDGFGNNLEENRTDKGVNDLHLINEYLLGEHFNSQIRREESEKLLPAKDNHSEPVVKEERENFEVEVGQNAEDVQETTEKEKDKLPIDRGWAWIILLASVCAHFIVIGQLKCFGIMFVQLQQRYRSSSSTTSVTFTLMNATYSVSALIIMTVGGSLPARTSLFIGAAIASVSSMITAFIDDVNIAFFTIGIAPGLANAFIMTLIATIINTYFVEKRGFANNIGNCGVSLGSVVLAPIVTKLFEYYSYTGTYIILTGLNLQLLVVACLLRPMSFYNRKPKPADYINGSSGIVKANGSDKAENTLHESVINGEAVPLKDLQEKIFQKQHSVESPYFSSLRNLSGDAKRLIPPVIKRRRAISESEKEDKKLTMKSIEVEHTPLHSLLNSDIARFTSTDIINTSLMDLTLVKDDTNGKLIHNVSEEKEEEKSTCTSRFRQSSAKSLKRLFDVKLLSKPEFQYFLVCNIFLCAGCSLATAFIAPLAFDNGISNDMTAVMISVMSIIELLSRFVVGYISDKKWCHRSTIIAVACFILGIAAEFLHFMTTFSTLMIYVVIAGLLQGVYFALFVVVILDILSFEEFKGALGFTSLIQGVSTGICMPIIGYLRDTTGTYTYAFNMVGACLIIGAVLIYFIPNVRDWSVTRERNKVKEQRKV